jgi:hypothetical protein
MGRAANGRAAIGWAGTGRARMGRVGTGQAKIGRLGDGSVRNGLVAKKVAADPPSFNWLLLAYSITVKVMLFLGQRGTDRSRL